MFLFFSCVIDTSLFITVSIVLLYWYLTRNFDYWKKRNVVFDKPYPLFGTFYLQLFSGKALPIFVQSIYKKYPNDDLVGGFMSRKPNLLVKNPDLIKQIFVKDFSHFVDRGFMTNTQIDPLTQHLIFATGDTWRALRQKLTPTFTSGKMKHAFPLLVECGKEFQNYLHNIVGKEQQPDIKDLMAKFSTDVIGTYAFGLRMNSIKDENSPFRVMGRRFFEPSAKRVINFALMKMAPSVYKLIGCRLVDKDTQKFFIGMFKSVIESRDNKPSARHDFVDLLIQLKTKGYVVSEKINQDEHLINESSSIKMTDDILAAQAFVFFNAGFETSSTTMSFALYELAKNILVQQKLIDEIDHTLSKSGGKLAYEDLKEMKYFNMVIDETLRKYPPVGILNRVCTTPYTFPHTKISIDKGVFIDIPVYALHHDPIYYPEPDKFIPERFLPEEVAKRNPFVYLPFGNGPRVCIGSRFGKYQAMIGLIFVLQDFFVETSNQTVAEIKFDPNTLFLSSDRGIYLQLRKRNI